MQNIPVGTSVRPGRIAVLVDSADPHWRGTCFRTIQFLTRMWGGRANLIVPTDGTRISESFWRLLEVFDPDYVLFYRKTWADIECDKAEEFERRLTPFLRDARDEGGELSPEDQLRLRKRFRAFSASKFAISTDLQAQLKRRLAPFYFEQHIVFPANYLDGSELSYPFTDVINLLGEIELPPVMAVIPDPGGPVPSLWWAAEMGASDEMLIARASAAGVQRVEIGSTSEQLSSFMMTLITRYEAQPSMGYWRAEFHKHPLELLEGLPQNYSMLGLAQYRDSAGATSDWTDPTVVIAGDTIDDFAFYYSLSRIRNRVFWLPPSLLERLIHLGDEDGTAGQREGYAFRSGVSIVARGGFSRQGGIAISSVSLSGSEQDKIKEWFQAEDSFGDLAFQIAEPNEVIPQFPVRFFEAHNADKVRTMTLSDNGVIPLIETPLPRNFKSVKPNNHRWLTELRIGDRQLPRHFALAGPVLGASYFTTREVRISSVGPTYFCPNVMILGGATAESSTPRPDIRMPETLRTFQLVAASASLSASLSDKGLYAASACEKFRGLDGLAEFLQSAQGQALASAYLDRTRPSQGDHINGCLLAGRRYFDYASLVGKLGGRADTTKLLDKLSALSILRRGFALKCASCRYADWHPFRDLSDTFTCKRCHREQVFISEHWLYPEQPQVYYQLDELIYLGLEHDMHVPILALNYLRRASQRSFLFTHELEYKSNDSDDKAIEVDINCVIDGVFTIGEAKKQDTLGKNEKEEIEAIRRYVDLAAALCAHQIVFATSSTSWALATETRIRSAVSERGLQLRLLTAKQLYF